jgi:hypothetical protein
METSAVRLRAVATAVLTIGTAVLVPGTSATAARYDFLDGAHWDCHAVSAAEAGPARTIRIADATGDPRAARALREFESRWNEMRRDPGFRSSPLPAAEVRIAATTGCSGDSARRGRTADVIVCRDDRIPNSAIGGPYLVDGERHTQLALVKLRGKTLAWSACNLQTAIAHEMGHVMGLGHNDTEPFTGGPSVMMSGQGPYWRGCPTWFNAHDRDALRALYRPHAHARGPAPQ